MRARSGGTPSSSSSRMVRRYISVVSTRSFTVWPPSSDNTSLPGVDRRPEPVVETLPDLAGARPEGNAVGAWRHGGPDDRGGVGSSPAGLRHGRAPDESGPDRADHGAGS